MANYGFDVVVHGRVNVVVQADSAKDAEDNLMQSSDYPDFDKLYTSEENLVDEFEKDGQNHYVFEVVAHGRKSISVEAESLEEAERMVDYSASYPYFDKIYESEEFFAGTW